MNFEDFEIPGLDCGPPPDLGYYRFDKAVMRKYGRGLAWIPTTIPEHNMATWVGCTIEGACRGMKMGSP